MAEPIDRSGKEVKVIWLERLKQKQLHSVRFVDGIETDSYSLQSQKFEFNMKQMNQDSSPASGNTGENAETKKSIAKLNHEMCGLSQQVTQLSKDLNEMLQLIRPVLMAQAYIPSPATSLISPSLNNTYSNSSGFSSGQTSQAAAGSINGQTCAGATQVDCLQPTAWSTVYSPSTLPQTVLNEPLAHPPKKNVYPALSLDSFLRHQWQHPLANHRGSSSLTGSEAHSPCQNYLPQTPLTSLGVVSHSPSSPVMVSHLHPCRQPEGKQNANLSLLRPFCPPAEPSDSLRDRMADLLGVGTLDRDFSECPSSSVTSLELVRSSSGDSQGDIIRFIDDEGTNV